MKAIKIITICLSIFNVITSVFNREISGICGWLLCTYLLVIKFIEEEAD